MNSGCTHLQISYHILTSIRQIAILQDICFHISKSCKMSYIVLARRYRPRLFSELIGQSHVVRTLLNGLKQDRLAHAYLFSGARGVGKTTTARLLAHAINCHNLKDGEPCGECDPCGSITEGNFIDVIEIDAASNRGIDDIRQLRDSVRYAPIEGKAKVYIIDEVHMLTTEAFNALLKTLEEPPAHAFFCLATTDPQKVPSTILSRCQRFDFRRVPVPVIKDHLTTICKAEEIEIEDGALDIIARRADGSVRDSLSLMDQVIAFTNGSITRQDAVVVAGEIRLDLYYRACDIVRNREAKEAFLLDEELAGSGTDLQDFLIGLQNHLIQILQVKSLTTEKVDLPVESKELFNKAAESFSEPDIVRLLQLCASAERDIRRNFNPRLRIQLLLLKFASFDRSIAVSDIIERIESGESAPLPSMSPPPRAGGGAENQSGHNTKQNRVSQPRRIENSETDNVDDPTAKLLQDRLGARIIE